MSLDWTNLIALWAEPRTRVALAMLVLGSAIFVLGSRKAKANKTADKKLPRQGGPWPWERWRHQKSVKVAGHAIDIAWRHIGIVATSGARKSTLLAMLLEQIGKTYVCITGDHAPPLLNLTLWKGYKVWTPRGAVAWYPWGGDLELAVQRVEHMFPASGNDAGVHRSMFKQAARQAWSKVDERARTVQQIMAVLPDVVTGSSGKSMAENWNARLKELVDSLGQSLKTAEEGGIDLVEEVKAGRSMMFALNSFADVSNRECFAKIAILETLRAADTVGNLSVAMDEVGLIGAELFSESVRVLRVRLCTGLFASHIADDFPKVLRGLVNVWFCGQVPGSDKNTRDWMSSTTFGLIPPEHFGEHALPLGSFYLVANGRVQKLTVPTWKTRRVPEQVSAVSEPGDTYSSSQEGDKGTRLSVPPDPRIVKYTERVGEHWVWKENAPVNQTTGYPRLKIDGKYQYVHIVWWEHVNGPRPEQDGEVLTVDHMCEHGIRCVWPGCKQLLPRRGPDGNTGVRWERERAAA